MVENKREINFKDILYSRRKYKSPIKYLIGVLLLIYAMYNLDNIANGVSNAMLFFSQ
jgi:hypothetical protein